MVAGWLVAGQDAAPFWLTETERALFVRGRRPIGSLSQTTLSL